MKKLWGVENQQSIDSIVASAGETKTYKMNSPTGVKITVAHGKARTKEEVEDPFTEDEYAGEMEDHASFVDSVLGKIPKKALDTLKKSKVEFYACNSLDDSLPPGSSFDTGNALGVFVVSENRCYIPRLIRNTVTGRYEVNVASKFSGTILHEAGHAVDESVGTPSIKVKSWKEGVANFRKLVKTAQISERSQEHYLSNPYETFAEMFSLVVSDNEPERLRLFSQAFPEVYNKVLEVLK